MASDPTQEDSPLIGSPNPAASYPQNHKGFRTPCECGKSMCLLQLPFFHCPKCHETYTLRQRSYPVRCGRCGFNVSAWRARNNIPSITPAFA